MKHSVMVVGNIVIDILLRACSLVIDGKNWADRPIMCAGGFASTVACGLSDLGCNVTLVAPVGTDPSAASLRNRLSRQGLHLALTEIPGSTPCSYIIVADQKRTVLKLRQTVADNWCPHHFPWEILENDGLVDWVAIGHMPSDTNGEWTRRLIHCAHNVGAGVSLTPGGTQLCLGAASFERELAVLDLLVLNLQEAQQFLRIQTQCLTTREAAIQLASLCGGRSTVVVTDGKDSESAAFDNPSGLCYSVPVVKVRDVLDPTGAGDNLHLSMIHNRLNGVPLDIALDKARRRGAAAVTVWGADLNRANPEFELLEPPLPVSTTSRATATAVTVGH